MRTLSSIYVYLLCLSGMYLGLVPGFPIEDPETVQRFQDLPLDPNHLEEARSDVIERTRHAQYPLSRLGRLIATYRDLAKVGNQSPPINARDEGDDSGRRGFYDETVTRSDYNQGNSNDDLIHEKDALLGSTSSSANGDYRSLDADESRSKRQQGWYIQYGKRSQESPLVSDGLREQLERAYYQDVAQKDTISPLLPSNLRDEQHTGYFPLATFLRNVATLARESGNDSLDETDERLYEDSARDKVRRPIKRQHEQAWYTQYGKRSGEKVHFYVL